MKGEIMYVTSVDRHHEKWTVRTLDMEERRKEETGKKKEEKGGKKATFSIIKP